MDATAPVRRTRVVAVGNQKGGVGKTTNTVHLAAALAELGKQTLIIDLDPNAGATKHFGIPPEFLGTLEVILGTEDPPDVVVDERETEIAMPRGVAIIPARRNLESVDRELAQRSKFFVPKDILQRPIARLRGRYDYIFLDTAPHATTPTLASYFAADWFVLSAKPEHFAIEGLNESVKDLADARQHGAHIQLLGVVVCSQQIGPKISAALSKHIAQTFGQAPHGADYKFATEISRSVVIHTAQAQGKTVFQHEPEHKIAEQYRALAREFQARVSTFEQQDAALAPVHG